MNSRDVNARNTGISRDYGSYHNIETIDKPHVDIDKEDHRPNNQCVLVSRRLIFVVASIPSHRMGSALMQTYAYGAHISTLKFLPGSRVLYVSRLHNYSKQLCY